MSGENFFWFATQVDLDRAFPSLKGFFFFPVKFAHFVLPMARGKKLTTPSTASSTASTPAPGSTTHKRATDTGTSQARIDVDGTDTEVDTPTRPAKKRKGQSTHEKASEFRLGFAADASNEDILRDLFNFFPYNMFTNYLL